MLSFRWQTLKAVNYALHLQAPPASRIEFLDSIRGLAALAVLLSHFISVYGLPPGWGDLVTRTPIPALWDGFAAVSMFFVLSGFVLSRKAFNPSLEHEPHTELLPYFINRLFRIGPPYACAVVVSAIGMRWFFDMRGIWPPPTDWVSDFWHHQLSPRQLLEDALLLEQKNEHRLVPQGWTLAVELKFSLLIPFFVLIAKNGIRWLVCFAFLSLALLQVQYFLFHFILGIVLAVLFGRRPDFGKGVGSKERIMIFAAGLALYTSNAWLGSRFGWSETPRIGFCITGIGSAFLLAGCLLSPRVQQVLSMKSARFLGRISYSFYLLHILVIFSVTPVILRAIDWHHEVGTRVIALGSTIAITILVSIVFYTWVEVPSIAVGRRIAGLFKRARVN